MRRYSILQPLYLSFYSADLYKDVRANWKGTGFLYLFLLLALTWLPVSAKLHGVVSKDVQEQAPAYITQVPTITITNGEVSIDQPVPYAIVEPETGTPIMVIDTTGTVASFETTTVPVLLTKNKLMYRQPNRAETRIYDLAAIDDLTVDRARVSGWVEAFRKYFAVAAYPFALAGSFAYRIVQMLLYAAIGLAFVNMLKASIDYPTLLRLACVAVTPAVILNTVLTLTGIRIPVFPVVSFGIAMGYLYFAVKANAENGAPGTAAG